MDLAEVGNLVLGFLGAQTALLVAIFFRLGSLTAKGEATARRVEVLEDWQRALKWKGLSK